MTADHPQPPEWFDISTPDAARARRFYQQMFGWTLQVLDEVYTLVGADGRPIGGIGQSDEESPYVGIVTYFRVADLDAALARAEQLGGARRLDPTPLPGLGRMAVFTDPDGNPVGLLGP